MSNIEWMIDWYRNVFSDSIAQARANEAAAELAELRESTYPGYGREKHLRIAAEARAEKAEADNKRLREGMQAALDPTVEGRVMLAALLAEGKNE